MLPDIDSDAGDEAGEGVLIGGGDYLEALSLGIIALGVASASRFNATPLPVFESSRSSGGR